MGTLHDEKDEVRLTSSDQSASWSQTSFHLPVVDLRLLAAPKAHANLFLHASTTTFFLSHRVEDLWSLLTMQALQQHFTAAVYTLGVVAVKV
jgi:hypothetical protein